MENKFSSELEQKLESGSMLELAPRSWIFVPAMRSDRFIKALNSGADAVIIDLEDAVDSADKQQARDNVSSFLLGLEQDSQQLSFLPHIWLRINNISDEPNNKGVANNEEAATDKSEQRQADIALCQQLLHTRKLAGVILPKVTTAKQVHEVSELLNCPVIAQIESALGMSNLADIVKTPELKAISYGRLDIANELNLRAGSQAEHDFFVQLRIQMLLASKVQRLLPPIESIYANFKDTDGMMAAARYASDLGFSGMLCIHPSQVAVVNQAFNATQAQLAFAKQVMTHYKQTGESIFAIDGVMVDLPVILQCQRLLESATPA
ncbi:HpcH/HpaI aldolase/citrate lyase family protein [Psychrobacter lutiphocae]|uniref:HpcH/HpaI aldolase/citrate lyase family protein n=1 Tax=Psychrobacter lutiphocae TaxID=540500 RepID=UPI000369CCE2|nr:CoA ester lyase [Psychrobacter lutiphocae]